MLRFKERVHLVVARSQLFGLVALPRSANAAIEIFHFSITSGLLLSGVIVTFVFPFLYDMELYDPKIIYLGDCCKASTSGDLQFLYW